MKNRKIIFVLSVVFFSCICHVFAQKSSISLDYKEYYNPRGEQYRIVFVWDTKTGKSARYYYNKSKWHKSEVSLPDNPTDDTSNQQGEIMMNYNEYYNTRGEQYRIVYVWNTRTGKSARYYYNQNKWHKSEVSLPDNPTGDASNQVGEIMMDYSEYYNPRGQQYRIVYVWNTKTGSSARYYYNQNKWHKSEVALPDNPLK